MMIQVDTSSIQKASVEWTSSREHFLFLTRLAERGERFEDMVANMKIVVKNFDQDLSVDERNFLSVGYKNVIGARRASWRLMATYLAKEAALAAEAERQNNETTSNSLHSQRHINQLSDINDYKSRIEGELSDICEDILDLLESKLIPRASNDDAKVYYLKLKGDYLRYQAEYTPNGPKHDSIAQKAKEAYDAAMTIALSTMPAINNIRLGLALNFSVFYYEILNEPVSACSLAQKAYDEALAGLESLQEDNYRESALIIQLLRDNLTLWNTETYDSSLEVDEDKDKSSTGDEKAQEKID